MMPQPFYASMRRWGVAVALLALPLLAGPGDGAIVALRDAEAVDQARAEEIFAEAEAAIWFPALGQARWIEQRAETRGLPVASAVSAEALHAFEESVEAEFPRFRTNAHGPWLLKRPATMEGAPPAPEGESGPVEPLATVFTDSFDAGMGNWTLTNNTLDLYSWGATTCEARTGTHAADALRGGVNTLGCTSAYASNVITTMTHESCEALAGAAQAWLDAYIHVATESGYDTVGFYYDDAGGQGRGYAFSGTWNAWFHVVFNLKQWYFVGDVTKASCPRLIVQFSSDEDTESGFGARVDDITIANTKPAFATAAIAATPASGAVPLTVNFTSTVSGASAGATYLWSFGDGASTTAATKTASFTYTAAGTYRVRFRVSDGATNAYAHTTVTATAGTPCSVACTASVPVSGKPGTAVLFQGTATATGCSGAPSYSWAFGDGKSSAQQNASHAYAAAGLYSWTLTASAGGASCSKSGSIRIGGTSERRRLVTKPADASLGTAVIGPAGGTLTGGGVTLTVPAGSFKSSATLAIKKTGAPREEGDLSDTFAITGLPAQPGAMTLDIEVGSASAGANEKFYVSADADMYVKSKPAAERNVVVMIPIEATRSGTKVRATIPATWRMPSGEAPSPSIASAAVEPDVYTGDFRVKAERLTSYQTAHFVARAYPSKSASATAVLNMLEAHYQALTAFGFSLACRTSGGTFRRIPVEVSALGTGDGDPLGYHVSGGDPCGNTNWLFSSDYLEITTSFPASDTKVRGAAGHELFHLIQDMYSPGGAAANLWLKEASSTWFETTLGICPDVQTANQSFPWRGLFNAASSATGTETRHGYGASYVLEYRTDASAVTYDPFVFTIWEAIRTGTTEVGAVQAALGSSLPQYWTEFSKKYFFGTATGGCYPTWASFARQAVADPTVLPKTTSFNVFPLSARSWSIDLQKFKATEETPVTIEAAGLIDEQSVYVYDVKAKTEIAELTKAQPTHDIPDVTKLAGTVLVLAFVDRNLPVGSSASTNKVTLNFGKPVFRCFARWGVNTYTEDWGTSKAVCTGNCRAYDGSVSELFLGSVANDKFHADTMWCDDPPFACRWTDDGMTYTNSLDFTFTQKGAQIEGFNLLMSFMNKYVTSPITVSLAVSAPLPKVTNDATGFHYRATGAGICGSITLKQTHPSIGDIVCDAASYFEVVCTAEK